MFPHIIDTAYRQQLDERLILRFATTNDLEPLAQFNGRIHGDHGQFNPFVAQWTREFASPDHPSCGPGNVTIVEDTRTGQIVSSMCSIPQTWTYDGVSFLVGRPEAVGTDPAYRRRGLIRAQFEVFHAKGEAEGQLAQVITGIAWYYRQFGYEYAIDLSGGRGVHPSLVTPLKEGEVEPYQLRRATVDDLPFIAPLYNRQCARSLIACPRSTAEWRRLIDTADNPMQFLDTYIVETGNTAQPIGYVTCQCELGWGQFRVSEFNVIEGQSLRAVLPAVLRRLRPVAEAAARAQGHELRGLFFQFGEQHPLFDAAPDLLPQARPPYAWYVRVPDLPKFLNRVAPVLEARLSRSGLAGHTGEMKVSEYVRGFKLIFEGGRIRSEAWTPDDTDNAAFPPFTFNQLLFGRRSLSDLRYVYPDVGCEPEFAPVLETLFPRRPSHVLPMA